MTNDTVNVFVGGVSDGRLQRGDVITAIQHYDATRIAHRQAEDIIRAAGDTLSISVKRGEMAFMYDDSPLKHSYHQSSAPWRNDQQDNADEEDYSTKSVSEIRQKFNAPPMKHVINLNTQPGMPSYVPKRPTMFHKKQPQAGVLADPGWVPMMGGQRQQTAPQVRRYGPVGRHSPPVNRPGRTPQQLSPPPPHHARDQHYEAPAWIGSLRHSGGPRQWELAEAEQLVGGGPAGYRTPPQTAVQHAPVMPSGGGGGGGEPVAVHNPRLQTMRYGPGGDATYEQRSAVGQDSDSARVAHLQYNTPVGLYSRANAQAALQAQTGGKAGYGTLQISGDGQGVPKSFNPAQSNVLRMVAEEDQMRGRRQPSRHHGPVHSNARPHHHQRPDAGHAGHLHAAGGDEMMGTSDF